MNEGKECTTALKDAPYGQKQVQRIKEFPLLRDNFGSLKSDFERVYSAVLELKLPMTPDQASKIKSDLLLAFCHGAQISMDSTSHFRLQLNIPQELEIKEESKIIMPGQNIITAPPKKIIT